MASIVWITGAGKSIGRAVALMLAARGAVVAASARTEEDLASLVAAADRLPASRPLERLRPKGRSGSPALS